MKPEAIDIATARNLALSSANYHSSVRIHSAEWGVDGRVATDMEIAQRVADLAAVGVQFTPGDVCMVYEQHTTDWDVFTIQTKARQAAIHRPWMILVWNDEARDKRGRIRRWGSQQAALREARKIEREILGVPKRKRVGAKQPPPAPGPLLQMMEP